MAIGTTAAAVIGAGASLAGGMMQADAASEAAGAQQQAAQSQLALQREMFETTRDDLSQFRGAGGNALAAYLYELGLGPAPMIGGGPAPVEAIAATPGTPASFGAGGSMPLRGMVGGPEGWGWERGDITDSERMWNELARAQGSAMTPGTPEQFRVGDRTFATRDEAEAFARANPLGGTPYAGISLSPAARFAMEQGRDTVEAGAAARGGLRSGATMSGLERLRFGLSAQDRENQLARLAGLTDMGMGAAGMQASNANAFASMGSQSLANMGNAQAAGAIGAGNAWNNAFGNLTGVLGYMARPTAGQFGQPAIGRQGSLY